jgi:stalled ribosome alternative rescue factor ArfA
MPAKSSNKKPRRRNPVARSLRLAASAPRVISPKKGKGSYSRKRRRGLLGSATEPYSE